LNSFYVQEQGDTLALHCVNLRATCQSRAVGDILLIEVFH